MARDAAFRYRTIDFVTVAMLGVAIGVAFWGWAQLYQVLSTLSTFAFPPSSGLFGGAWLLGGVIGGLVIRKPGAALLTEVVAASVEALLGNSWGLSTVISGTIQGFGVELVLAVFLWKRFGPLVAALAAAVAAAFESFYEWQVYYTDWALPYQLAHLGFFVVSGVVIAGFGGWALVRGLAATGALDAFGAGREHHERTAV
ncbi:energy-coupling factor transport system substrate-specific component [Saccharopolyspora antimicrobica]|uniref:Energy-coupling factor transport system substrate-specific component n=1 Tax=Saccharopolyspora antimicrobica TaxID=455193 RepID=A0A1I4U157_9PSEU|nr:ECF transporter S component [Saccharopolyspora antimicrobica]RKT88634.1 energy-coupling factor transport system substrate-specific component [Saccharopolyspora antimicrobica]SFM82762.1 energy-coupling factor transport system substrate-specific component [Saccharopolyspora antimicrobica]